jgi:hypothetical protein
MPRRQDHPGPHGDRLTCRRHVLADPHRFQPSIVGIPGGAARLATAQAACSASGLPNGQGPGGALTGQRSRPWSSSRPDAWTLAMTSTDGEVIAPLPASMALIARAGPGACRVSLDGRTIARYSTQSCERIHMAWRGDSPRRAIHVRPLPTSPNPIDRLRAQRARLHHRHPHEGQEPTPCTRSAKTPFCRPKQPRRRSWPTGYSPTRVVWLPAWVSCCWPGRSRSRRSCSARSSSTA